MMGNTIGYTEFNFPNQKKKYHGKVRDIYILENDLLVMVLTDRISAFDTVLPKGIPYKGQILNQITTYMLQVTQDIVPNWLESTPDPNVAIGCLCEPFKIEMVIRGYLSGHAARVYQSGKRVLCGVAMPEKLRENDPFPEPIITPSTKAAQGDVDISKEAIISKGIVSEKDYAIIENYTKKLFQKGTALAKERGLILVDAKYEFGKTKEGKIILIDELHTPDASRYFYAEGYEERQSKGMSQKQLSKEFVRQWLINHNFQGLKNQKVPFMSEAYVQSVSHRYIELFENITGTTFVKADTQNIYQRIQTKIEQYLNSRI